MENVRTRVWERVKVGEIVWFVGLMAIVAIIPHYVHNQFITGPIVNTTLFIGTVILGSGSAMLIGLVPSVVALASGLLPASLAPMVPFIMISNAVLVWSFGYLRKINYWAGVAGGTLLKYLFLYATSTIVVSMIANKSISAKAAATMLAWPQIVTALVGGVIAYGILKMLKKI